MKRISVFLSIIFILGACREPTTLASLRHSKEVNHYGQIIIDQYTSFQIPSESLQTIINIADLTNDFASSNPDNKWITNRYKRTSLGNVLYSYFENSKPERIFTLLSPILTPEALFGYRGRAPYPSIWIVTPVFKSYHQTNAFLSGIIAPLPGNNIRQVRIKVNNGSWNIVEGETTFATNISITRKTNKVTVAALMDNGWILKSMEWLILKDTTSPSLTIDTPLYNIVSGEGLDIEIEAIDSQSGLLSVHYQLNDGPEKEIKNFVFHPKLWKNGENTLTLIAKDWAGNISVTNINMIGDITKPEIFITHPKEKNNTYYTNQLNFMFAVRADDPEINGYSSGGDSFIMSVNTTNEHAFSYDNHWTNQLPLSTGSFFIRIEASDEAGNISTPQWINVFLVTNKIRALTPLPSAGFGTELEIDGSGNYLFIGSPHNSQIYSNGGSLTILKLSNRHQIIDHIFPAKGTSNQFFGKSISSSSNGSVIVVGAPGSALSKKSKGRVYIYEKHNERWDRSYIITPSHSTFRNCFGWSVDISDDGKTMAAGAYQGDTNQTYTGLAYIFTNNGLNWLESATIVPVSAKLSDQFGWSVSLSGNGKTLAVSAPGEKSDYGAVYVYTNHNGKWIHSQTLDNDTLSSNARFGYCIKLSGNGSNLIVSAPFDRRPGMVTGSLFYYQLKGTRWQLTGKILDLNGTPGALFGYNCDISYDGSYIAVSSINESYKGVVYVYQLDNNKISFYKEFTPIDADWNDHFGTGICISPKANLLFAGSPDDDDDYPSTGSVYSFSLFNIR